VHRSRVRLAAVGLAVAGVLFLLYPAVRPWHDESTVEGATAAMASGAWVASHYFAVLGFILIPPALLALRATVSGTRAEPIAFAAAVVTWVGAGLTLPYFGAEDFGLHALAAAARDGQRLDLLDVVEAVRMQPVALTTFGIGLVALGIGAVLAAVAVWRSGTHPRSAGIPFAVGLALFMPQFYTPPAVRIGHGVLVAVGCVVLAFTLWNAASDRRQTRVPAHPDDHRHG
jgi:hypothetical protein